jgi:MFS family permease
MPTPEPARDSYAALRNANFRNYAAGFFCAAMGLQMIGTAVAWEIFERTNDVLMLGYVGLARALPVVLLALPAGHIADTHERRSIIAWSQVGFVISAIALLAISVMHGPVWSMYVVLAMMGVVRGFNGPARGSFLPTIVPMDIFQNAVSWTSSIFQLAAVLGPVIAGILLGIYKTAWPVYLLATVGSAAFAVLVLRVSPLVHAQPSGKYSLSSMFAGMQHLWKERTIFAAIMMDLFGVLLGGATALMPYFAKDVLKIGEVGLGILRAAPFVGAFIMGIVLAHRPPIKRSGPALLWSVAAFGVTTIIFGYSTNVYVSVAALLLLGATDNITVVIRHVLVQVRTPDHLRGRVGAVNSLFIECSNELGAYESGLVAKLTNAVFAVVSGGVGTILVTMGVAAGFPELRKLGELKADPPTPAQPPITTTTCASCGGELPGLNEETCPECGTDIDPASRSGRGR